MRTVRLLAFLATAMLVLAAAPELRAQTDAIDVDVRAGIYTDGSDGFLGAGVLWDMGNRGRWYANPNLEYVLVDNGDLFTLNGDVHYDLDVETPFFVWVGGGPALLFSDPDNDNADSETDVGLNLLAGIGAREGSIRPFAQVKLIVSDESQLVFAAGLRF